MQVEETRLTKRRKKVSVMHIGRVIIKFQAKSKQENLIKSQVCVERLRFLCFCALGGSHDKIQHQNNSVT